MRAERAELRHNAPNILRLHSNPKWHFRGMGGGVDGNMMSKLNNTHRLHALYNTGCHTEFSIFMCSMSDVCVHQEARLNDELDCLIVT